MPLESGLGIPALFDKEIMGADCLSGRLASSGRRALIRSAAAHIRALIWLVLQGRVSTVVVF